MLPLPGKGSLNLMLNGSIPLLAKDTPDTYRMPQFARLRKTTDLTSDRDIILRMR
jgi:hypothetical protein